MIEREPASSLDLDTVARSLATSRRQLQRAFTRSAGRHSASYALDVRMRRARELLRDTDMSVREIAERVGYRKPPQFCKTFRRQHGQSPSRFRGDSRHDMAMVRESARGPIRSCRRGRRPDRA